jgi:hypothetical protein
MRARGVSQSEQISAVLLDTFERFHATSYGGGSE